jgi:hypothetical protein
MKYNDHQLIGDAGEFLTLFHLAKNGFKAYHVPTNGYDLVVETDAGLKRISVKSRNPCKKNNGYGFSSSMEIGRSGSNRGKKILCKLYCEIIACVAIDIEKVIFLETEKLKSADIYIPPRHFSNNCEKESLDQIKWLRAAPAILQKNNSIYQFSFF